MRLVVIIPSIGRREVLRRTLKDLDRQIRAPEEVVISVVDPNDMPEIEGSRLNIKTVVGPKGAAAQRNTALRSAVLEADIITFIDDDFLLADDYLTRVETVFENRPDIVGLTGKVVADGINGAGLTFEEGLAALNRALLARKQTPEIEDASAYGCNMSFRASAIKGMEFDERLPLYGWQEDRDFSFRVSQKGRVVRISNIMGVHLGVKGGRVSGVRLGYSQVVNPVYLVTKGTMSISSASNLMFRNIAANAVKSFFSERWVDRRGRLLGNIIGISDVITGRADPERVLKL